MVAEHRKTDKRLTLIKTDRGDDVQLAALAASGDRIAQRRVVQMLLGKLRNVIVYAVNDALLAEDLTQSAMLKILCSLKNYRGESSLEFWATRIALRMAMRAMKTARRRRQLLFFLPDAQSPFRDTDAGATKTELRWRINTIVAKLSEKQQVAIRLRYVHEYSIKEIAAITGSPENSVRERLRVGKKKLKRLFDKNSDLEGWIMKRGK